MWKIRPSPSLKQFICDFIFHHYLHPFIYTRPSIIVALLSGIYYVASFDAKAFYETKIQKLSYFQKVVPFFVFF